jgi:hypothetical protein
MRSCSCAALCVLSAATVSGGRGTERRPFAVSRPPSPRRSTRCARRLHEQLRQRGIDPTSSECEQTWLVAGSTLGRLLASPETIALLANIADDEQRGGIAAFLLWSAGISPHEAAPR